ncbi:MAG TPA: DUF3108 domain-containing protein, partial [Acidobacteriaceae bacterium]
MTRFTRTLLLLPVAALALAAHAGAPAPAPPVQARASASATLPAPRSGWSFPNHQTLSYAVDWRVFPAGTAVLHLDADGDAERINVVGDSTGAINLLFRVSDRFQSSFSRSSGCSAYFAKQLVEGHRLVNSDQRFAYPQSRTTYDEHNLVSHIHRNEQSPIPSCVTDLLSAMFYMASQPLQVGQQMHIPVAEAGRVTDVVMHVEARASVRTPAGPYQTLRVQPTADAG